jgi:hypothetical protein
MSILTRRSAAPLPPPTAPDVPGADPAERARLDVEAADTAAREAGRRVADLRRALDHMLEHPLEYPEASYSKGCDDLRRAVAKAADDANRANRARTGASETYEAAKVARAVKVASALCSADRSALNGVAQKVVATGRELLGELSLAAAARAARVANGDELRAAGLPVEGDERLSLSAAWPDLVSPQPGIKGAFLTAAALVEWLDPANVETRERVEAERIRSEAAEEDRRQQEAAIRGHLGPDAQQAAARRRSEELARFYPTGGGVLALGAVGSAAAAELAVSRRCAGLEA